MSTSPRHARRRYRTTFYHRLVGSFLVVSTILVLLISTVSYQLLYRQYTREIAANHQRVIEYDGRALASDIFQKGQRLFADLSMNPQYTQVLSYFCQHPAEADHVMLLNVYESLRSLQAVYPDLLSSVMIHYPQQQFLISSTHGFKRQEEIQNQPFQAIVDSFPSLDVGRISWWTMADAHSLPNLHDNQILFGGIPAWNSNLGKHAAQVYLFVNSATVSSMLNNIAMEGSATYFLGQNGEAIASSASGVANMRLPEDVWQALQDSNERYVSMASTQDGIESLYTVCSIPSAPWKLALVMPMADYMRTARSIIGQIAIGVVASLALLLPLTAYVSRRLYTPVQQLAALVRQLPDQEGELSRSEHEAISACIQRLSTRLSQAERQLYIQKPILRHVQLQRLLDGGQDKDGGISSESLQMAGISFPHAYFAAVYCEWIAAEGQAETEVESIRFSLIAEMEEKFKQADFCLYGYAVDRTHTAWVLNAAQPDHIAAVQIAQTAEAYMQGLGLQCLCSIGAFYPTMRQVKSSYRHARALMAGRFFAPADTTLLAETKTGAIATYDLEQRYAQHLQSGSLLDAIACLRQLALIWVQQQPTLSMESLHRIGHATLSHLARERRKPDTAKLLTAPDEVLWNIAQYPDAMKALIDEATARHGGGATADDLVERTRKYILANLSAELSVDSIAEDMHFSPKYFSRLFKELSGVGLNAFLNTVRLEEASTMLRETDQSVESVAQQTGYNSTQYFIRKFKEGYGVTPRQYQLNQRRKP